MCRKGLFEHLLNATHRGAALALAAVVLVATSGSAMADDPVAPGNIGGFVGGVVTKAIPNKVAPPQQAPSSPQPPVRAQPTTVSPGGNGDTIVVQLKNDHGVYKVPVKINGAVTIDFIIDSGASTVSIPDDVMHTLMRSGTVSKNNIVGSTTFQYANGSKAERTVFRLDSVQVGDRELKNVLASSETEQSEPLLGQSFLSQFASWTQNTSAGTLILTLPKTGAIPAAAK